VTSRSLWSRYDRHFVGIMRSVRWRRFITVANISESFYLQGGGKNQLAQIWNKITTLSLLALCAMLVVKTQHFWQTPSLAPRNVRRILVRGVNAPLPPELTQFAPTCGRPSPQNVQQVSDFSQMLSTILPGNSGLIRLQQTPAPAREPWAYICSRRIVIHFS